MLPDWQTLFGPRPLTARAVPLTLGGVASTVWFASAHAADFKELSPEAFLSAAESARAGAFKFGQPRENFTLGRLAGKLALERGRPRPRQAAADVGVRAPIEGALGDALSRLEIGNGERGEPVVRDGELQFPPSLGTGGTDGDCKSPALRVSLSHVNGLGVAVAFPARARVGLDLELIDERRAETVRKGVPLSAEEEAWLKATALPEATALLLLWTAREALGKALGCGLACRWETLALREIEVTRGGVFSGEFLHQPLFRCVSWLGPDAVMSVAFEEA